MKQDEQPLGLGMTLAMNAETMPNFKTLDKAQKKKMITGTRTVKNKEEMHPYVGTLVREKS